MAPRDSARRLVADAENKEDLKERLEREHRELLDELRALIPGAEVLFGFLLAIRFTEHFAELTAGEVRVYYATLICTSLALVLFLAPAAHHRVAFREGDKEFMLKKGNREAVAGSLAIAVAFTGVLYLVTNVTFGLLPAILVAASFFSLVVWRWWAWALVRSRRGRLRGDSPV